MKNNYRRERQIKEGSGYFMDKPRTELSYEGPPFRPTTKPSHSLPTVRASNHQETVTERQQTYKTRDLGLVAALVCLGYEIKSMDKDQKGLCSFAINRDPQLEERVHDYYEKRCQVDAQTYFVTLRTIKNRIHES